MNLRKYFFIFTLAVLSMKTFAGAPECIQLNKINYHLSKTYLSTAKGQTGSACENGQTATYDCYSRVDFSASDNDNNMWMVGASSGGDNVKDADQKISTLLATAETQTGNLETAICRIQSNDAGVYYWRWDWAMGHTSRINF